MKHDDVRAILEEQEACSDARKWVKLHKGTSRAMWNDCENGSWMLWIAARLGVDRKTIVRAACACARESLKYVRPGEDRPRICIETTERWTQGLATIEEVRQAKYSADAAADAAYAAYAADAADAAYAAAYAAAAYAAAADAAYAAADAAYADAVYADAYADADALTLLRRELGPHLLAGLDAYAATLATTGGGE